MRILIYKRTHSGDPDRKSGVFGNRDCMGAVRGRRYDAVIGIGGTGPEPSREHIAAKLTWVGIGPHKDLDDLEMSRGPQVTFDHFWYRGERGPLLEAMYPALARRMYDKNVRVLMYSLANPATKLDRELTKILGLAKRTPCSTSLRKSKSARSECRSATSAGRKPACPSKMRVSTRRRCNEWRQLQNASRTVC